MGQSISYNHACRLLQDEVRLEEPFVVSEPGEGENSMQRVACLAQKEWLCTQMSLPNVFPQGKKITKVLSLEEKASLLQPSSQHELNGWQRVNITMIMKPLKKIRIKQKELIETDNCTLFDFLHHISNEEKSDTRQERKAGLGTKERGSEFLSLDSLIAIIEESRGVRLKKLITEIPSQSTPLSQNGIMNPRLLRQKPNPSSWHLLPLLLAFQSDSCIYLVESAPRYTLHDVLAFSPAIVANSAAKYMFIFYQILEILAELRVSGFSISPSITFKDFYVTNSMWISASMLLVDESDIVPEEKEPPKPIIDRWLFSTPSILTPPFLFKEKLHDYTTMWVNCEITNFDYIMILNTLVGRRIKDPAHYPVFPWVMDFSKAHGGLRDITKSKYRLCKSDTMLDLNYNPPSGNSNKKDLFGNVPHHISDDPLTSISYYVYMARRVPKEILCKNVRSRWVPDEYPSSLERLYELTPEECTPEFYTDPSIFESIHPDLPDLILPSWAASAEDFITHHRSVLEGTYVSQHLNSWIDLIFGYKLSGIASIDSKNVYLSLVDGHSYLTNAGVVQLFSRPHPVRKTQGFKNIDASPDVPDIPNNSDSTNSLVFLSNDQASDNVSDDVTCISGKLLEEDIKTQKNPGALRRDIWSIDSAIDEASYVEEVNKMADHATEARPRPSLPLIGAGLRMRFDSLLEATGNETKTPLADDFQINISGCDNFIAELEILEKEMKFQGHIAPVGNEGVGKFQFGSVFDSVDECKGDKEHSQSISNHETRNTDIKTLANLLVELALHEHVRLRTQKLDSTERLDENSRLLQANLHRFPSWLLTILNCWMKDCDESKDDGIDLASFFKDPSLLLYHYMNPFPFPTYFKPLHHLLSILYSQERPATDLNNSLTKQSFSNTIPNGDMIPTSSNIIWAAQLLPSVMEELDKEGIELLLVFLLPLFSNPATKLTAFLNMFHAVGTVMGAQSALKSFYADLQKLYDNCGEFDPVECKLLDQAFISKVITVFGLSCFLECFMQFVIDGLIEKSDSGSAKEKSDTESLDRESLDNQQDIANKFDNDSEKANEEVKEPEVNTDGENIKDADRKLSEDSRKLSDTNSDRSSSFLDDDDNVDLFNPRSLQVRNLARSGVFTRLESILEDDHIRKRGSSDESDIGNTSSDMLFKSDTGKWGNHESVGERSNDADAGIWFKRESETSKWGNHEGAGERSNDADAGIWCKRDGGETSKWGKDDKGEDDNPRRSLSEEFDQSATNSEENGNSHNHKFLQVVDKSEVIYVEGESEAKCVRFDSNIDHPLSQKSTDGTFNSDTSRNSNDMFTESQSDSASTAYKGSASDSRTDDSQDGNYSAQRQDSENSYQIISVSSDVEMTVYSPSSSSSDGKGEARSTLSRDIANNSANNSPQTDQNRNLPVDDVAQIFLKQGESGSTESDMPTGSEEFSIDSMCSEEDTKSFLIRRSAVRVHSSSGASPFMVLSSDDEQSGTELKSDELLDGSLMNDVNLQVDKIPDADALGSIDNIPDASLQSSAETDLSPELFSLASVKWIVPWLGPTLTTKYVVHLILKRMPKIWLNMKNIELTTEDLIDALTEKRKYLMECLVDVVRIYGSAIVLWHFIPYATKAVESALKASTVSAYVEGQLVSAVEILIKTLVLLTADTLSDRMEVLSQEILEPLLRLLSSFKPFASGSQVRSVLLHSLVGLLGALSQSLGQIDAREVMTPLLQRFFSCFDCVYRLHQKSGSTSLVIRKYSFLDDCEDDIENEIKVDDSFDDTVGVEDVADQSGYFTANDSLTVLNDDHNSNTDSMQDDEAGQDSTDGAAESSDRKLGSQANGEDSSDTIQNDIERQQSMEDKQEGEKNNHTGSASCARTKEFIKKGNDRQYLHKDLCNSFTPALAYYSYVLFCRVLGDHFVASILYNEDLIWQLCSTYDEGLTLTSNYEALEKAALPEADDKNVNSVQKADGKAQDRILNNAKRISRKRIVSEHEEGEPVYRSSWQHVEGEWLEQWKDRLESKNDDANLNFKGRRLQTYAGHSSAVRDIYVPDNEHYFLSASRDKTVKLWLLKNHGNGTAQLGCSKTYDKHTRSVFAVQSIESRRLAVSCDGSVHVWDQIKSATVTQVDLGKNNSVLSMRTLPVPYTTVAMATAEGTIRLYDIRQKAMCEEWKLVSSTAAGSVKCLCVNDSGTWIAAGFSSGFISVLDLRTGILRGQWRAHESEILQIVPYNEHNFLSSSNDLRLKMWNEDGSLALRFRNPSEPVNCLNLCKEQCIWATTSGNRIGITHDIENWASYESKKLPQEVFKGSISKLTVLPVNQLYLVGSENGNVVMFA